MDKNDERQVIGDWSKRFSESKKKYYWFNRKTGASQWHKPVLLNQEYDDGLKISGKLPVELDIKNKDESVQDETAVKNSKKRQRDDSTSRLTSVVGIIVPFRDMHPEQKRSHHLVTFLDNMKQYVNVIFHP